MQFCSVCQVKNGGSCSDINFCPCFTLHNLASVSVAQVNECTLLTNVVSDSASEAAKYVTTKKTGVNSGLQLPKNNRNSEMCKNMQCCSSKGHFIGSQ